MAIESVAITAGTTDAIAVDTVGTVNYQVNKISIAADGAGGTLWDGKTQGGTIDSIAAITTGTIANSGTTTGVGTVAGVGVVGNINGGSIVVTAGTIGATSLTAGTLQTLGTVGTVQNINGGSIVVTAGTIAAHGITAGTLQTVGTVGTIQNINGGSLVVTAGTVVNNGGSVVAYGAGGTGVAAVGNPIVIAGVDSGGSVYRPLVDTTGKLQVVLNSGTAGTVTGVGTVAGVGTVGGVGVVGNVNGGSIVITAGTIAAHGITAGTLQTVGTVGTIQNINKGSIVVTAGTIASSGTATGVGVVGNVNGGSIVVTAGTIASSGTATGVGVVGNVNGGSIVVTNGTIASIATGTIASITNLAGGTVKLNYKPSRNIVGFNQTGTTGIGTLVAAPGVGTSTYITALTISVMSGTLDVCVGFGTAQSGTSVVERGLFIAGGGLVHDYPVAYSGSITNADLVWTIVSGAGTVAISGKYWSEAQ